MAATNETVDWRSLLANQQMPTHDEEGNPLHFHSLKMPVPAGHVMDEFGQLWRVTYLQEWSSGKRQFTVEPVVVSGSNWSSVRDNAHTSVPSDGSRKSNT